jgi:hypothetical protein
MTNYTFDCLYQECAEYRDYHFSDGNPCKSYVVSKDKENGTWYGLIRTSDDEEAPFDDEQPMPEELVNQLRALIPQTTKKESHT